MSLTPSIAAVEYGEGELIVPSLEELFEWPAYWFSENWQIGFLDLSFNRVALLSLLATGVAMALLWAAFGRPSLVPGRFQGAMEGLYEFIRDQIGGQAIGRGAAPFMPFLLSLFLFTFINNFFKVTPGIQFPATGRMALPAFLAILVWVVFIAVGVRQHGPLRYFKDALFPPGVPKPLYVLVAPIELVSTFVVRPVSLAVRLFANMLAGHLILAIVFITTHAFLAIQAGPLIPIGVLGLVAGPLVVGFEAMVTILQAYIFTMLTAVYIGGSLNPEH